MREGDLEEASVEAEERYCRTIWKDNFQKLESVKEGNVDRDHSIKICQKDKGKVEREECGGKERHSRRGQAV